MSPVRSHQGRDPSPLPLLVLLLLIILSPLQVLTKPVTPKPPAAAWQDWGIFLDCRRLCAYCFGSSGPMVGAHYYVKDKMKYEPYRVDFRKAKLAIRSKTYDGHKCSCLGCCGGCCCCCCCCDCGGKACLWLDDKVAECCCDSFNTYCCCRDCCGAGDAVKAIVPCSGSVNQLVKGAIFLGLAYGLGQLYSVWRREMQSPMVTRVTQVTVEYQTVTTELIGLYDLLNSNGYLVYIALLFMIILVLVGGHFYMRFERAKKDAAGGRRESRSNRKGHKKKDKSKGHKHGHKSKHKDKGHHHNHRRSLPRGDHKRSLVSSIASSLSSMVTSSSVPSSATSSAIPSSASAFSTRVANSNVFPGRKQKKVAKDHAKRKGRKN